MKSRLLVGLILIISGAIMQLTRVSIHYYISDVLLPPTEPPLMKSLEGFDKFLITNSNYFSYMDFISLIIIPLGVIMILISRRKRK